jgi:YesN/AraC family two-component response regulator
VPHKIITDDNEKIEVIEFEFLSDFVLPETATKENASNYLDFAYLKPFMVEEENIKLRFTLDGLVQIEVEKILKEVLEEFKTRNDGYILLAKALLLKLLILISRSFSNEIKGTEAEIVFKKYKEVVDEAKEYITNNYNSDLTLDKIASAVNYSKSRFCFIFKAVAGETYIEYLNAVRIEKAKDLLKNSNLPITEISYLVGYYTIANFNKNFKLITGITPREYRLSVIKNK